MIVGEILGSPELFDIVATAEIGDTHLTPPDHVVNVARLAMANKQTQVSEDVANYVKNWVAQQQVLQQQAAEVIAKLEKASPLPTPEQLISGNPDWPTWMGTWWANTLRFPWAGHLAEAIASGLEWLDGKS